MKKRSFWVAGLLLSSTLSVAETLTVDNAWVRALPPTQSNTAAYLTLHNAATEAITINGASAELAAKVEIHNSAMVDGMMRMEQLKAVTVPAGGRYEFAPGGAHLMLLNLKRMPAEGESLKLCLVFDTENTNGQQRCVEALVRKTATDQQQNHHQHH